MDEGGAAVAVDAMAVPFAGMLLDGWLLDIPCDSAPGGSGQAGA